MAAPLILGAAAIIGGGALLGGLLGRKKETHNHFHNHGNQPRSPEQRQVDGRQNGRIGRLEQEIQSLRQELNRLKGGGCTPPGLSAGCAGGGGFQAAAFSGCGGGAAVAGFFRN